MKKLTQQIFRALLCCTVGVAVVCPVAAKKQSEKGTALVQCGADRLFSTYFHLIKGRKVALVANHSGILADGTHLADTLFKHPDVTLNVLFGMEFNVRTNDYSIARDGEKAIDKETGLFKYSLYGETHKPTKEMLGDTEVMVFDIQEVGMRFYEHVNILGFVMEAAAENNIEIVVLDRPNPITGLHPDGFVTDDDFLYRFGSYAKIPVRHGMTMGELARLYNGEQQLRGGVQAALHVVEMTGWKRDMWYDETGLAWKKPSPNLITLSSVLAYAGTCLFEGLNISEGRGTDKPFEYIGAPWVDHVRVVGLLQDMGFAGVRFEPITFTPERKSHLGRDPELNGQLCKGVYIHVTDRNDFDAYRIGIALLWAIHHLHGDEMVWNQQVIERLTGTDRLINMIKAGQSPQEIYASWQDEVADFMLKREKFLIYD